MSPSPTNPDHGIGRLVDEGYQAPIADGWLLIRGVPYVDADRVVRSGILALIASFAGDRLVAPKFHLAWWVGAAPCDAAGVPLRTLAVHDGTRRIASGVLATSMLCIRPRGREFLDYYEYATAYVAMLAVHAGVPERRHDARGGPKAPRRSASDPFRYVDTASSRAGTSSLADSIRGLTIGIVGLGGTGSYVLDLVAKCPVGTVNLYDPDAFEQHNAFRCPGAVAVEEMRLERPKVEYFADAYAVMRHGVVPHRVAIDASTAPLLDVNDFVFVCVDDGAARAPILDRLRARGIPGVDVGMGLSISDGRLVGAVRTTLLRPTDADRGLVPRITDTDHVYGANVQIAELNALNAALAVLEWKRFAGFAGGPDDAGHSVLVVETGSLHRLANDESDRPE